MALADRDWSRSSVRAIVPAAAADGRLHNFAGSLWGDGPGDPVNVEGGIMVPVGGPPREALNDQWTWLAGLVAEQHNGCLVAEEGMMRASDPGFQTPSLPAFVCEDAVYYFAASPAPMDQAVVGDIMSTQAYPPLVGVVTSLPPGVTLADRAEVPAEVVEVLAERAVAVLIGAWDGEGLLVATGLG